MLVRLAVRYENAEGVDKNLDMAVALYCAAARQGSSEALFRLGWVYSNGRGVAKDEAAAASLFKQAANKGHEYARRMLQYVPPTATESGVPICLLPDPPIEFAAAGVAGEFEGLKQSELDLDSEAGISDSLASLSPVRAEIEQLVYRLAPQYAIDPKLALAVITVESAFNASATSPKNAQGLMQLIPQTAERFGVRKAFVPIENIRGGLAYLRWLLAFFQGDIELVAAAYNAGERAVERYRGVPPYAETRSYVRKITSLYKKASHPYQSDVVEPSSIMTSLRRTRG